MKPEAMTTNKREWSNAAKDALRRDDDFVGSMYGQGIAPEIIKMQKELSAIWLIPMSSICTCSECGKPCSPAYVMPSGASACQTCYHTVYCECGRWAKTQEHVCLYQMLRMVQQILRTKVTMMPVAVRCRGTNSRYALQCKRMTCSPNALCVLHKGQSRIVELCDRAEKLDRERAANGKADAEKG